jgi:hypothetical protein
MGALVVKLADCGADRVGAPAPGTVPAVNLPRWSAEDDFLTSPRKSGAREKEARSYDAPTPRIMARRASASPISTKAEVTSGPPTRMRVGVFILFHS